MSIAVDSDRLIGNVVGKQAGPTLVLVGGMHGNEPAGVMAATAVLEQLRERTATLRGELIAFKGNRRALALKTRYQASDLNRMWTAASVASAHAAGTAATAEQLEVAELDHAIEAAIERARGPVFVLDLHTTSANGVPFLVVGGSPAHRAFAHNFPLPGIIGLEEVLAGVLTGYFSTRGCVTLAVEGGQHQSAAAATNLEAVVTVAVVAAGLMQPDELASYAPAIDTLARARGDLPQVIEVMLRHAVQPQHQFRMEPGFANIQRTRAGTLLAHDESGEIRAPSDGLVLLPLYQPQGADGFFFGREA